FFFYVPRSKIIEVELSAEDAATLIMSCGVVQPGSDPQKKIAALAGMANAARVANAASLQPEPAKVERGTHRRVSSFRDGPKDQTSDEQLHIGESRDSGFAFSTRPGMTSVELP